MARIIENARVLYLGPSDLNSQQTGETISPHHIQGQYADDFRDADVVIYRGGSYIGDVKLLKSRW